MDNYQSEIFKFLTTRDNFESFIKLMSHYDNVREELLKTFWRSVDTELRALAKNSQWVVTLDTDIFVRYAKLQMYMPNWKYEDKPLVSFTWEGLSALSYRGLLVYTETKGVDVMSIRNATVNFKPSNFSTIASQSWAWWRNADVNFSNPKDLIEILPDKCEAKAKEWARELYELATRHEVQLDEIVGKALRPINP